MARLDPEYRGRFMTSNKLVSAMVPSACKKPAAAKSLQSYPTLCDPRDGSPPGSPVPGILLARTLERVAISFSNAWKWNVQVKSLSRVRLLATPWTAAYQAPPSMGFSRQEYWSGVPLPSPCKKPRSHLKWGNSFDLPPSAGSTRDRHSKRKNFLGGVAIWRFFFFFSSKKYWKVEYCGWEFSCSTKCIVLWLNSYCLRRLWPFQKILCFTFECCGGWEACSHNFGFIRSIYHTVLLLLY